MKNDATPPSRKSKKKPVKNRSSTKFINPDIEIKPGHYIRRLHQISDAIFKEETYALGITPAQVAVLFTVKEQPDIDQNTLAKAIDFDPATVGGVIDRLEKRGMILRQISPTDRRVKLLSITNSGIELTESIGPALLSIQKKMLAPLSVKDRVHFAKMLKAVVEAHT